METTTNAQPNISQFFGQTHLTTDCLCRCIWLILSLDGRSKETYGEFYAKLSWLDGPGFHMHDAYRLLRYYGYRHRISFPTDKGTYIVAAPINGRQHAVVYSAGVLYDSGQPYPIECSIAQLKELISMPIGSFDNWITVAEILRGC